MNATTRTALALLWLIVLIAVGFFVSQRLELSGDLRKFMPGQDGSRRVARRRADRAAGRRQAMRSFTTRYGIRLA